MNNLSLKVFAVAATLASTASLASAQSMNHVARIPAGADVTSIRFKNVKVSTVPASYRTVNEEGYCRQAAMRDPGGSMYCGAAKADQFARVYRVTFSYVGTPLASDEYGKSYSTFTVDFRADELTPAEQALLNRKGGRSDAAGTFQLTISREDEPKQVVDNRNSTFCQGGYSDGVWVRADSKCQEDVRTKTAMIPSDYITVRVDLAQARAAAE